MNASDSMVVKIFGRWWQNFGIGDILRMLVPDIMLEDQNGQNRHQHLKAVANAFHLQHQCSQQKFVVRNSTLKIIKIRIFRSTLKF